MAYVMRITSRRVGRSPIATPWAGSTDYHHWAAAPTAAGRRRTGSVGTGRPNPRPGTAAIRPSHRRHGTAASARCGTAMPCRRNGFLTQKRAKQVAGDCSGAVGIPGMVDRQRHAMAEILCGEGAADGDRESLLTNTAAAQRFEIRRGRDAPGGKGAGSRDGIQHLGMPIMLAEFPGGGVQRLRQWTAPHSRMRSKSAPRSLSQVPLTAETCFLPGQNVIPISPPPGAVTASIRSGWDALVFAWATGLPPFRTLPDAWWRPIAMSLGKQ